MYGVIQVQGLIPGVHHNKLYNYPAKAKPSALYIVISCTKGHSRSLCPS